MATISIKNIAQAIYESSHDKDEASLSILMKDVVRLINKKRLLTKSDKILKALEKIIDDNNGVTRVKISSHGKLEDKEKKEIEEFIKKKYKSKEVELSIIEDEKLLGGIKIETGDEILDMTLSNKVQKLQNYLIEN
jgi:F0F1-type ATP synthase delta subunit